MRTAFTYMFKDTRFNNKFFSIFILTFIMLALCSTPNLLDTPSITLTVKKVSNPFIYLLPYIGMILYIILCGYLCIGIKAIQQQTNNIILPFLNYKTTFLKGLKFFFSLSLLILLIVIFITSIKFISSFFLHNNSLEITTFILTGFFLLLYMPAFIWLFSAENKLTSFLAWKKARYCIRKNSTKYYINIGLLFLINIAGELVSKIILIIFNLVFNHNYFIWLITSFESSLILTYLSFVSIYLIAKSIK